mmetsp:Transcript_16321/g.35442  ORF Transcript_16321/g.35442 Transcript_16321/m.35442 type:complete len:261 (+) Transcript_16321:127-909(+)
MSLNLESSAVDLEKYKPDKAELWSTLPIEHDQWIHTHNALRTEIRSMLDALDTMAGRLKSERKLPEWSIGTMKGWWDGHLAHATNHCEAEEQSYRPVLSERFTWPKEVETIHNQLDFVRDRVGKAVGELSCDDKATLSSLRNALSAYEKNMLAHFDVEERTALPLMRAYFGPEEISTLQRKMLEDAPENVMGALIYAMGADRFRSEFMKERGIPFFVWHVAFKGRLAHYTSDMVAKVDAIKSGVEPVQSKSKKAGWFGST